MDSFLASSNGPSSSQFVDLQNSTASSAIPPLRQSMNMMYKPSSVQLRHNDIALEWLYQLFYSFKGPESEYKQRMHHVGIQTITQPLQQIKQYFNGKGWNSDFIMHHQKTLDELFHRPEHGLKMLLFLWECTWNEELKNFLRENNSPDRLERFFEGNDDLWAQFFGQKKYTEGYHQPTDMVMFGELCMSQYLNII